MDTDYERDQRDQREDECRQAELDADRRADHAPAPPAPRTPREQVEALIDRAGGLLITLGPGQGRLAEALRLLDQALEVLRDPHVVDGALLLERKLVRAVRIAEDGEYAGDAIREVIELVRARTRADEGDEIPVHVGDFEPDLAKRQAVLAVLVRHRMGLAIGEVADELLDELVAAAETGI